MKKLFNKAMTVLGSLALVGATLSGALAANYSTLSGSNTAVVVGSLALSSDSTAAASVIADLGVGVGEVTITGGDVVKLEKMKSDGVTVRDAYNIGDALTATLGSTLDDGNMPEFLANGEWEDSFEVSHDYTQTIELSAETLRYFQDKKYEDNAPTVGFYFADDATVLTYTLVLEDAIDTAASNFSRVEGSDINILGKEYYVLDADATELTLLDSTSTVQASEGDTVSVVAGDKTYSVTITYLDDTVAKLTVDGVLLSGLKEGESKKLADGSTLLVKELYGKDSTGYNVEFTIGNGEIILDQSGDEIEIIGETYDGLTSTYTTATGDMSIVISWKVDGKTFVTEEDNELVMPGFNALSLVYGGYKATEGDDEITLTGGEFMTLETELAEGGSISLPLAWYDASADKLYLSEDNESDDKMIYTATDTLAVGNTFIMSHKDGDEFASYVYKVSKIDKTSDNTAKVDLISLSDEGNDVTLEVELTAGKTDEADIGDFTVAIATNDLYKIVDEDNNNATADTTWAKGDGIKLTFQYDDVNFAATESHSVLYTKSGYEITLDNIPTVVSSGVATGAGLDKTNVVIKSADADGNAGAGKQVTIRFEGADAAADDYILIDTIVGGSTTGTATDSDAEVTSGWVYGDLPIYYEYDKSDDEAETVTITTFTEEVVADVSVTSGKVSSTTTSGAAAIKDSETANVDKNLVVVGGSCVNTVAAELLGGAYCGSEFKAKTGVGEGQFMIKAYEKGDNVALLVAGYEAADTTKAVAYLLANSASISLTAGEGKVYSTATSTVVA